MMETTSPNPLPCVQLCITNFNLKLIVNFGTTWRPPSRIGLREKSGYKTDFSKIYGEDTVASIGCLVN